MISPSNEPSRLDGSVVGVEDRRRKAAADEMGAPLGLEAVLAQRLELGSDLHALFVVRREAQAAGTAKRVAGETGEAVQCLLGQPPVLRGALRAEPLARTVVRHRPAAQREPAVAAARAFRHAAGVVDADALARRGERQGSGDARYAGADDLDVRLRDLDGRELGRGVLCQPPRRHPPILSSLHKPSPKRMICSAGSSTQGGAHMRATHLIATMLGMIAAALIAVLVVPGHAGSAQAPLPVIEQRNPAFAPFQVELAAKSGFCGEVTVPAGRRLVVEFVSGAIEETSRRTVTLVTTAGGETVRHYIKLPEFDPTIEIVEGG